MDWSQILPLVYVVLTSVLSAAAGYVARHKDAFGVHDDDAPPPA